MKKNIAVIFGGRSAEHEVSIITAHNPIIKTLKILQEYNIYPVYISKNGRWYSNKEMLEFSYFQDTDLEKIIEKEKPLNITFNQGLTLIWPGVVDKKAKIDIVFPAMHGTLGEDGALMGVLNMSSTPYVGCGVTASAIAMDKAVTKQLLKSVDIPVTPFVFFSKSDWKDHKDKLIDEIKELKWPLFVKPVHLGSSIGISKVKDDTQLINAIEVAFHYDDKVLIEESVEDLVEVTLPIIGNNDLLFGAVERPLNKSDFFNFQEKYIKEGNKKSDNTDNEVKTREIPAKISNELTNIILYLGEKTYRTLDCSGIARIDFLIERTSEKVFVNEVNTLPGSLYQHNFREIGLSNVELINKLIALAIERYEKKQDISYTFKSEILNKIRSDIK